MDSYSVEIAAAINSEQLSDECIADIFKRHETIRKKRRKDKVMRFAKPAWDYFLRPVSWPVRFLGGQAFAGAKTSFALAAWGAAGYGGYTLWQWLQPAIEVLSR